MLEMSATSLAPGVRLGINPVLVQVFFGVKDPLAGVAIIFIVAFRKTSLVLRYRLYSMNRDTYWGIPRLLVIGL